MLWPINTHVRLDDVKWLQLHLTSYIPPFQFFEKFLGAYFYSFTKKTFNKRKSNKRQNQQGK
ncbi:uncharacterized protein EV154DRAFT_553792 [Mucor mucedo]|uniref:uncharacterized protein n=1 Tax=Mucor mucedo TaxID=29922 RepID=UPI00221F9995|nr:uncharacterized protein EV154DRAFT_553792 [Mucor mucedo]KAI7888443.1 hypothetical protein EV154DRAFT_553792 [Mucor mucedo]